MLIRNYTHFNPISNAVKLFNEIYYQLTKIEYEKNPYVDIKDLTQDIKANVGLLQNGVLVLNMMHIFLYLIDKKTSTFLSFERILRDYIAGLKSGENVFEYEQKLKYSFTIHLRPHPCDVKELNGLVLDWNEITNDFDKESIKEVLELWSSKDDRFKVLHMIEFNYLRTKRNSNASKIYRSDNPSGANPGFFIDMYSKLGHKLEIGSYAAEDAESDRPTYEELVEENYNLKKKNAILESENERLRSERNPLRQKKNRERAFSLGMIVDYCKKHLNIERSNVIVGMLNKFLRDAQDYTQAECDLVDSIEIEYLNKKYGDTVMGDKNYFYGNSNYDV